MSNAQAIGRDVELTVTIDQAPERVFAAWTDPDVIATWWGPGHGFFVPRDSVSVDAREGGRLELRMVNEALGFDVRQGYEIVELDAPHRLVMRSDPMPEHGMPEAHTTRVELRPAGGGTELTFRDGPYGEAMAGPARDGWAAALEQLRAALA